MLKVNELIKQILSSLIHQEIELPPNTLITVIKVETARDLKNAKVWVSIMPGSHAPSILKILAKRAKHLQHLINDEISLKFTPKLNFVWDKTEEEAAGIEELFKQINEDKLKSGGDSTQSS